VPRPAPTPNLSTPPTEDDAEDLRLVASIRAGEQAAWGELISRYQDRLFTICLRMVHNRELAADLTQDAFVKVIQGLDKYDGRSKLSTWIIRVTMNVCLSKIRSEKLRRHASLEGMGGTSGSRGEGEARGFDPAQVREPGGVLGVLHAEDRHRVLLALQRLDPDHRAVLILRDARDLEYEQIAEVLGVAVGTVKSRLFRAREALRDEVEKLSEGRTTAGD
jgi:RNA polymerase sigma-70 factor (ECF subfamily)